MDHSYYMIIQSFRVFKNKCDIHPYNRFADTVQDSGQIKKKQSGEPYTFQGQKYKLFLGKNVGETQKQTFVITTASDIKPSVWASSFLIIK